MANRRNGAPLFDADAILRKAWFGVWLLGLAFIALAVWGLVRFPHWTWVTPIVTAVLALAANHRLRGADRRGQTVLLGVAALLFVVISGVLVGVVLQLARS
jgi:hypothetical protein